MKLPLKVSRYTPTLDMHMRVRGMATEALAEKAGTEPRNVKRWREVESCPQKAAARDLAEALEIPLGELANMLAAGFDAKKDTERQRALRWANAALGQLKVVSKATFNPREVVRDLVPKTKRKKWLKLFPSKPPAVSSRDDLDQS